ncbi:hypothetical protein [Acinetobacter sp. AC1-2]|uniref:hypothetical protein n=1 Tax=Acinetobacter sp. AC1-2 TaxID=2735132 RepID=UPI0039B755D0
MYINKILLLIACAGLLAACQQQVSDKQEKNDQLASVKLPIYQSNGVFASARLRGPLQLKQECLYVNDILIIFPEGYAEWDPKNQILTFNDKKVALGEELDLVGGFGQFERDSKRVKNLSASCDHKSIWLAG